MNTRPYSRAERYGHELQKLLGELISRELDTSSIGFVTVTDVKMTNDLKIAKVYVSAINSGQPSDQVIQFFDSRAKYLRGLMGSQLTSKSVPELRFYYDNSEEEAEKIERLFMKLHSEKVEE